jgi:hypothetical protein
MTHLTQTANVTQLNVNLAEIAKTDPRLAIRLREEAIAKGIKGTSLTLGSISPTALASLEMQRDIQNFPEKKAELQREIDLLKSEGRIATVNTSELSRDEARQRANEIFRKQQGTTLAVSSQVRTVLDSQEFQEIKARGGSSEELANLLNNQGVTFSKSTQSIINELAQADIQGETQTSNNIQAILEREGVSTSVNVRLDDSPLGASFTTSESAQQITQPIQTIISTIPSLAGIQTFTPEGEPIVQGGLGSTVIPTGGISAGAGGLAGDLGSTLDSLLGSTGINPLFLVGGVIVVIIILFTVVSG